MSNNLYLLLVPYTAKLGQQRFEPIDRKVVSGTVCGEYAVTILQIGSVVTHLKTKQIGKTAASFLKNNLRGAGIPKLCSRAGMDVDVTGSIDNKPDF